MNYADGDFSHSEEIMLNLGNNTPKNIKLISFPPTLNFD